LQDPAHRHVILVCPCKKSPCNELKIPAMLFAGSQNELSDLIIHPKSHLALLFILLFALSFLLPMIFRLFSRSPRNNAKALVAYVQKRGYALVNPSLAQALDTPLPEMFKNPALRNSIRASSDITDINWLDNGTGDWLAFTCNLRSKEVTIFNLNVTSQQNATGVGIPYQVAKIKVPGLPRFSLGRNSVLHTLENVVGQVAGTSNPAITLDPCQYPEFAAHFWIRASDPAAVTSFLPPDKVKFLETAKLEGIVATNTHYLVYFEDGTLLKEQDFDAFISRVDTIIANLL
jgi:hypothetical protein